MEIEVKPLVVEEKPVEVKNGKITKKQTAEIPTKNGSKYSYQYVDIAQIHDYLESINAKYIQQIKRIDDDDYIMTKRCFDGNWEEDWLQGCKVVDATLFGSDNPAQKQGSALTYARRYSLLMAFGLATEDDDAVNLGQGNGNTGGKVIPATEAQRKMLQDLFKNDINELMTILSKMNKTNVYELSIQEASSIISQKKGK